VVVHPQPLVTLNSYAESITVGDSVSLTAFNATTYEWMPGEGLNTQIGSTVIASPDQTTLYTVTGTNEEGCSRDTSALITVMPLGIDALNSSWSAVVYPNPARTEMNLQIDVSQRSDYQVRMYNKLGELVLEQEISERSFNRDLRWRQTMNLSEFAAGVYILKVGNGQDQRAIRVVIQ